jgi:hypothetical protein
VAARFRRFVQGYHVSIFTDVCSDRAPTVSGSAGRKIIAF